MALMPPADAETTYVVCEGPSDAVLIARLLVPPARHEDVRVLAAGGMGAAASLARTLLTTTPSRVAVAVDADAGASVRGDVGSALAAVADPDRWGVFVFAPSVEVLLATDPLAVAAVLGRPVDVAELTAAPAAFFKAAAASRGASYAPFVAELARRVDLGKARSNPVFQQLSVFVTAAPQLALPPAR